MDDDWLNESMLDIGEINGDNNPHGPLADVPAEDNGLQQMDMDDIILSPLSPPPPNRVLNIPIPLPRDANTNCSHIVENVVYCLQRGENRLVECPSEEERRDGILYAVLSYWHWKYEQRNLPGPSSESDDVSRTPAPIKIFYATKSFKETEKVIHSLNRIGSSGLLRGFKLAPPLGTKKDLCRNEDVKTEDCVDNSCCWLLRNQNLSKPKRLKCPHFSKEPTEPTPLIQRNIVGHKVLEIEDLLQEGNQCIYYDSVRALADANFIVCSKEFILSSILRQEHNINLKDSIVIFDDGSNLELECHRESSVHIAAADLREACNCFKKIAESLRLQVRKGKIGIDNTDNSIANASQLRKTLGNLSSSLEIVLKWMRAHGTAKPKPKENDILEVLRPLYNEYERNGEESMAKRLSEIMELSTNHNLPLPDSRIVNKIRKLLAVISYIFGNKNEGKNGDYCMRLLESDPSNLQTNDEDTRIFLALTCGNPSLVFRPIEDAAATVIVASSCLAPLSPLQTELGVGFHQPVEIRDYDVANKPTFFTYCGMGPNNVGLTLQFGDRDQDDVKKEVGESILEICDRILDGGVVVVFHSEYYLKQLLAFWKNVGNYNGSTLFSRLSAVKHVVSELEMETDNEKETKLLLQRYRDLVRNPDEKTGALLITLARGKLNEEESWNLTGPDARAIIHVSIPYGYQNGVDFMFARIQHFAHTEARDSPKKIEWNHHEAFRILNQSFGKAVQENNDWRIVIILDKLMEARRPNFGTLLPAWVRQSGFQGFRDFNNMMSSLEDYVDSFPES